MSASVPFVGFSVARTRNHVALIVEAFAVAACGRQELDGRRLMIAIDAWPEPVTPLDPNVVPADTLRIVQMAPFKDDYEQVNSERVDGIHFTGSIPSPEDVAEAAAALPGKRLIVQASSGMYIMADQRRDVLLRTLESYRDVATDFLLWSRGPFTPKLALGLLKDLHLRLGETHGLCLAVSHSFMDGLPMRLKVKNMPYVSLMMPFPENQADLGKREATIGVLSERFRDPTGLSL